MSRTKPVLPQLQERFDQDQIAHDSIRSSYPNHSAAFDAVQATPLHASTPCDLPGQSAGAASDQPGRQTSREGGGGDRDARDQRHRATEPVAKLRPDEPTHAPSR